MWKRDESVKPASGGGSGSSGAPAPQASAAAEKPDTRRRAESRDVVNIGRSVVIKGELNGSEDLTIEGTVEGKIELRENILTIGPNGRIKAEVFAKAVIVLGEVNGNVTATEKVDIRDGGSVDGDLVSPRVAIAEGAHFRGSVDMQKKKDGSASAQKPAQSGGGQQPQAQAQAAAAAR